MGRYQVPLTAGMLVVTILGLGIGQSSIYFLNKHKIEPKQIVMNSIFFGLFGIIVLAILLPFVFTIFEGYFGVLPIWVKIFYSFGVSSSLCFNLFRPILTASLQIRQSVQTQVANKIVFLVIVSTGFAFKFCSVNFALSAFAFSNLIALAVTIYYIRDRIDFGFSFVWPVFIQVLRYGLKLLASNFVYVLNATIGVMLLRYLMPESFATIGFYGRAAALCCLITLIPYAVGPLLYSKWSGLSGKTRNMQVEFAMRLHLVLGALIVLLLVVFADWCILFLYGREFLPAAALLRILAVGVALRCAFNVCNNLLASDGRAHLTAYIMGSSVIAITVLTWILVPHYGIKGAAYADLFAGILVFAIGIFLMKHLYRLELKKMVLPKREDYKQLINAIRNKKAASVDKNSENNKHPLSKRHL